MTAPCSPGGDVRHDAKLFVELPNKDFSDSSVPIPRTTPDSGQFAPGSSKLGQGFEFREDEHLPVDLRYPHYDILFYCTSEDMSNAETFRDEHLKIFKFEDGSDVKICTFVEDKPHGTTELESFELAFNNSTYTFMYITEVFIKDFMAKRLKYTALWASIENEGKRHSVVPIFDKRAKDMKDIPYSIASIVGYELPRFDKYAKKRLARQLNEGLQKRVSREDKQTNDCRQYVEKQRREKAQRIEAERHEVYLEFTKREHESDVKRHLQRQESERQQSLLDDEKRSLGMEGSIKAWIDEPRDIDDDSEHVSHGQPYESSRREAPETSDFSKQVAASTPYSPEKNGIALINTGLNDDDMAADNPSGHADETNTTTRIADGSATASVTSERNLDITLASSRENSVQSRPESLPCLAGARPKTTQTLNHPVRSEKAEKVWPPGVNTTLGGAPVGSPNDDSSARDQEQSTPVSVSPSRSRGTTPTTIPKELLVDPPGKAIFEVGPSPDSEDSPIRSTMSTPTKPFKSAHGVRPVHFAPRRRTTSLPGFGCFSPLAQLKSLHVNRSSLGLMTSTISEWDEGIVSRISRHLQVPHSDT